MDESAVISISTPEGWVLAMLRCLLQHKGGGGGGSASAASAARALAALPRLRPGGRPAAAWLGRSETARAVVGAVLEQEAAVGGGGVAAYGSRDLAASVVGLARLVAGGEQQQQQPLLPPQPLDAFLRAHAASSARRSRRGEMGDRERAAVARAYAALDGYLARWGAQGGE